MQAQLPVNLGLWLVALVPLAAILVLLVGLRWKAASAAPVGYFLAVAAALLIYQTSARIVGLQTVKGIWDAVFILYVIVPALLLYQTSKEAGAFEAIRRGMEAYTPNNLLHVLGFGWVFASFLQGITGFGAPIAVTAPLLVAVGVRPFWAVVIPLIGHAWANTFGTLAVAWEGLLLVTTMPSPELTAVIAAAMLLTSNLLAGFAIAWLYGRWKGVREALPAILVIATIHGGGQLLLVSFLPTLAVFFPGTLAIGAVLLLAKTTWYREPSDIADSPVMTSEGQQSGEGARAEGRNKDERSRGEVPSRMPLLLALAPYLVLVALIVVVLLIEPIRGALSAFEVGLPFPRLVTGYGVVTEATPAYSAFSPLTHPGTFLLAAAVVAYLLFKTRGHIPGTKIDDVLFRTVRSSIPPAISLFALVSLAKVLEGSGQVLELALGIGAVAPGPVYALLSPLIGLLGSFMASSNLSSNILFGPLQESTAEVLGLPQEIVLAGQTAGAAIGNSMAPGNALLGIGAVGLSGETGNVIRKTVIYALAAVAVVSAMSLAAALLLFGG